MKITGSSVVVWVYVLAMLGAVHHAVCVCHLDNYVSSCILDILEEHIEATAIINHCHIPLDVTFLIAYQYKNSTRHTWKYTFVTTNQNERVLIPGFLLPIAPHAPVFLYARVPEAEFNMHNSSFVAIEASFIAELDTNKWEEADFLNHTVFIPSTSDCGFNQREYDPMPWYIIGGLLIIVLVSGVIGTGGYYYRRKKLAVDQLALVSAMEVGFPGSQPYQMDAAVEQSAETSETQNKITVTGTPTADSVDNVTCSSTQDGEHTKNSDVLDNEHPKSGKKGFKFGRLKEEIDISVIISNPAYQEDVKNIQHQTKDRERVFVEQPNNIISFHNDQHFILENGNGNSSYQEEDVPEQRLSHTNSNFMEESARSQTPENQEVVDDEQYLEYDNRESSNSSGQQVGQGARRKVRGLTSSIAGPSTSSSTIIASEVSNSADSQKSL